MAPLPGAACRWQDRGPASVGALPEARWRGPTCPPHGTAPAAPTPVLPGYPDGHPEPLPTTARGSRWGQPEPMWGTAKGPRPLGLTGSCPVILCPHIHWAPTASVLWLLQEPLHPLIRPGRQPPLRRLVTPSLPQCQTLGKEATARHTLPGEETPEPQPRSAAEAGGRRAQVHGVETPAWCRDLRVSTGLRHLVSAVPRGHLWAPPLSVPRGQGAVLSRCREALGQGPW